MNILFCDDEETILELYINEVAHSLPIHKLFGAKNGAEGLEICQENHIDYVFTDGRMPVMDGIQLSKGLQGLTPPPIVFMITGYAGTYDEEELLNYGIREVFYKPIDYDWLIEFITNLPKT